MNEEVPQPPPSTPKVKASKPKPKSAVKLGPKKTPYSEMIMAAVMELKETKGSSRPAILKYMMANYGVGGPDARFRMTLKRLVDKQQLVPVKGSFKFNKEMVKAKKPAEKIAKKTPTKKKPGTPKKAVKLAAKKGVKAKPASKKAADPKKNQKKLTTKGTPKKATPKTKKVVAGKKATPKTKKVAGKKGNPPRKSPAKKTVKKVVSKSKKAAAAKTKS